MTVQLSKKLILRPKGNFVTRLITASLLAVAMAAMPIQWSYGQNKPPVSKQELVSYLLRCRENRHCTHCQQCTLQADYYMDLVMKRKVDFVLTAENADEIRHAADFLESWSLENFIGVIKNNSPDSDRRRAHASSAPIEQQRQSDSEVRYTIQQAKETNDPKLEQNIAKLISLISQLAAKNLSIADHLRRVVNESNREQQTQFAARELDNINQLLKSIIDALTELQPKWAPSHIEANVKTYQIYDEKRTFVLETADRLTKTRMDDDDIKNLAADFEEQAQRLTQLAKDIAKPDESKPK